MLLNEETLRFIHLHAADDVRTLALHAHPEPGVDLPAAVAQIAGRKVLAAKVPAWAAADDIVCPPRLSLEQCSSEATARHKAAIVQRFGGKRHRLADLTGGLGVDCSFLAPLFEEVDYVERQETLCELAAYNFPQLGLTHIHVHWAEATEFLEGLAADWIFLDPARRNAHGGKTVALADCEPDVTRLEDRLLGAAPRVLLKLSPMLDLTLALHQLGRVCEAHVVAVDNECKELLLVLERDCPAGAADRVPIHCTNLRSGAPTQAFTFTRQAEQTAACPLAETPGTYLYEPNAALLKAGAFRSLAQAYGAGKLHPSSHLYTSDRWVEDFPGRRFRIVGWSGFGKKELKALLGGVRQANLSVRNFPAPVSELRKRLRLADGGDTYLFATTLADGRKALIRAEKA
ncbi:MAG TPA: class I SAM-dependent methyltransferase [Candidatus Bacteroides merdipullorum]|uniref:Class I SAM-dependent methyltransferase n=1 Tax=Candidatus Bacteroides merdipullorum TaxID=2838474 RepID=A0A9D2A2K1_9BACE|nr:class I SAM-dependent methyltransferase [Candidatus Bacteroides merdipullorum]